VLVRNLCLEREPLYGLADWAGDLEPRLVGLAPGEAALLNDDRVGRALDELFDADRGSLLTDLVLAAISEFAVDCSQLPRRWAIPRTTAGVRLPPRSRPSAVA